MISTKTTLIAAGLLALAAGAAPANAAVVEQSVHLRSGPGTRYAVITTMPSGVDIEAWNCNGAWCQVSYAGRTGYASQRYLNIATAEGVQPGFNQFAYAPNYRTTYASTTYAAAPAVTYEAPPPAPAYAYAPGSWGYGYGYAPGFRSVAFAPGYETYAAAYEPAYVAPPAYVEPAYAWGPPVLPNPLAFPLFPWNWGW